MTNHKRALEDAVSDFIIEEARIGASRASTILAIENIVRDSIKEVGL